MTAKGTTKHTAPTTTQPPNVAPPTTSSVSEKLAAEQAATAQAQHDEAAKDETAVATADRQRADGEAEQRKVELAKHQAQRDAGQSVPDIDPKVPLTVDEVREIDKARATRLQADAAANPNAPPLTDEAKQRMADAEKLPPAPFKAPAATPGASATNPALVGNDVDASKTPPFGNGNPPVTG